MGRVEKQRNWLPFAIYLTLAVSAAYLLFADVFLSPSVEYPCKRQFLTAELWIFLATAAVIAVSVLLIRRRSAVLAPREEDGRSFQKTVIHGCVVFCLLQIYVSYNYFFLTGWDVQTLYQTTLEIANGTLLITDRIAEYFQYFSMYPNNLEVVGVFALCLKINAFFGVLDPQNGVMVFVALNSVLMTLTGYLLYDLLRRIASERWALFGWVLFTVYIGVSPWVVIPYSDSLGLIFPTLSLWLLCRMKTARRPWIFAALLGITGRVGYHIKPQLVIVLIAAAIFYAVRALGRRWEWKRAAAGAAALLAFLAAGLIPKAINAAIQLPVREEGRFGYTHFIMMGMNPETRGIYSAEDCDYSHSFFDRESRKEGELAVIRERLKQYGVRGYAELLRDKLLITYNDGSFAWGLEGGFWLDIPEPKNAGVSAVTRAFYYEGGAYYPYFLTYMQFFWLALLLLQIFSGRRNDIVSVAQLALLGLMLFEMLFEVRARYLYTYAPVYVLLGVCGLRNLTLPRQPCRREGRHQRVA